MKEKSDIKEIIRGELESINSRICKAIDNEEIKQKHFERNHDLKKWVSAEYPLTELFIVEKLKYKSYQFQQGDFRVNALYGESIKETIWETVCVESSDDQTLKQKIAKHINKAEPNTSYPSLLETIYVK